MPYTRYAALVLIALLMLQAPFWSDDGVTHDLFEDLGGALLVACVLGRTWCSAYIGGRKKRVLVGAGPYSVVRNPLYLFSFIGVLGIGLASATVTLPLILAAFFVIYYAIVVRYEEAMLRERFGGAYSRYLARVPRWRPDLRLWQEFGKPRIEWRYVLITLRDSAWFFSALPAFELLERLHEQSILPVLILLP
ncbi:MAG: methyltransferase family protein [Kiloniellaceae bacterium]